MAEEIVIAELSLDDSALLASTAEIRRQIDALRESQKQLDRSTAEGSAQFVKNEATIKQLNREYRNNQRAIQANIEVTQQAEVRQEMLNSVLGQEVRTIEEAREQTRILTQLRNQTNATTDEGAALIAQLNEQLDRNTEFVRENADGFLRLRLNIGNYAEGMQEALNNLNPLNGGLTGFITRAQEAGGVGNLLTASLAGAAQGFIGMAQASIAFIATPIGAVLVALVAAFALVQNALNRSEEATGKLSVAFGAVSGIINRLLGALEPLGNFLIDVIVAGFELAADAANAYIDVVSGALEFLGFDDAANSVRGFRDEVVAAAEAGRRLAQAEGDLEVAQRRSQRIQLEYQKTAEELRQTRDNDVLSINERIKANDELGVVLQRQLQEELRIANLALEVANLRLESEGRTATNLKGQEEALTRIADIQERITGQESEQLTNRNSLLREARQLARQRAEASAEALEREIEIFAEERRFTDRSNEDRLQTLRLQSQREIALQQQRLRDGLINEQQYNLERLRIANELREAEEQQRQETLAREQEFENRRDELQREIRLAREQDEQARAELELQQEFQNNVAELERLEITETERTQLLTLLTEQRGLALQAIRDKFNEERLEAFKKTLEEENEAAEQQGQARLQIERSVASALIGVLGDSLAARLAGIAVDAALQVANIQTTTAAAQATNLAQATAVAPPPLNLPFIAQAVAQNAVIQTNSLAQISNVLASAAVSGLTSTLQNVRFRKGGIVPIMGASHEQGGVPIFAGNQYIGEAEGGEGIGILNRAAFSDFMGYNNSFNAGQSGNGKFQGGGIMTQVVPAGNQTFDQTQRIVEEIQNMQIFVAVEDINTGQANFAQVVNGANLG